MSGHEEARQALEDIYLRCAISDGSAEVWRDQVDEALDALDASVGQVVELRKALNDLYEYVQDIEGRYGAQVAVRSYLSFPDGAQELGERVRAVLSAAGTEAEPKAEEGGTSAVASVPVVKPKQPGRIESEGR